MPTEVVFECAWDNCDWQFEDNSDAVEHAVADPTGHVNLYFQSLIAAGQTGKFPRNMFRSSINLSLSFFVRYHQSVVLSSCHVCI